MGDAEQPNVPSGWSAIRADFAHFCKVHGARTLAERLWVLGVSRAFWGLALYRAGRFVYLDLPRAPWTLPLRALYGLAYEVVRRITKTSLDVRADIGKDVWLAPQGEIFMTQGAKVGPGARFHGGNTLGLGGRPGARGKPQLGAGVQLCPGAAAVGAVVIPDGAVIGPGSLVGRSLPHGGGWLGTPPKPSAAELVPAPRALSIEEQKVEKPEPFWPAYRADLERHFVYHPGASLAKKLRLALTLDGSWAMAVHRFGRSLRTQPPPALVAPLLWAVYRLAELALGLATAIYIDVDARIEPGFYVGHFVSLQIGPGVRIGKNSSVSQMVTLSGHGGRPWENAPSLGERVYVGAGAKIIGPWRVGDGASISANSVVVADVPANGVVLGNPGAVISLRGSGDFIYLGEGRGQRDEVPAPTADQQRKSA